MNIALRGLLAVFLLAGLASSCGGSDSTVATLDVSTCQDNWSVLLQASTNVWDIHADTDGSGLRWSNGQLYFQYWDKAATNPSAIASISTSGSDHSYSNVAPLSSFSWWIENDQVIYIDGNYVLTSLPLAGGAQPTQLVDLVQGTADPNFLNFLLDAEAVYWISWELSTSARLASWRVWRALRSTGERQQLAIMPILNADSGIGSSITLTQDSVMVLDNFPAHGTLYVVPKSGGEPRVLPPPSNGELLATSSDGVALWLESLSGGAAYKMWRSTIDGAAPTPFWTDKPLALYLTKAWSDGNGGWHLAGWENTNAKKFSDSEHTTIWSLDSSGHGVRLACNPFPGIAYNFATAFSPADLFLLYKDVTSNSIVSIAR
jgi:hypothetical protein